MSVERNTDRGNKDWLSAKASAVYQTEIHTEASYTLEGNDFRARRADVPSMIRVDDIGEVIALVLANGTEERSSAYATLSAAEARALGGALVKAAEVKEEYNDG